MTEICVVRKEVRGLDKKRFQTVYLITICVLFLTVLFPVYQIANKPYPIILGLPFSFFWVVLWIVITFLIVLFFYFRDPDREEE